MGDWAIIITGTGQHHNDGDERDADVIFDEVNRRLIEAGQKVHSADFVSGQRLPGASN